MKTQDSLWQDAVLTEEDVRMLRAKVIQTPLWGLSAKEVLPQKKVDEAVQSYQYQVLADYGVAGDIKPRADFPGMQLDGTLSNVSIAKVGVAFGIAREDVLSAKKSAAPLDSKYAEIAAQQVNKRVNNLVWNGSTAFGITGLLGEASLGTYSSGGWSSGDVYDDVRKAQGQVQDEYSDRRMTLVCNRDNFIQLNRKNTNTDMSYRKMIEEDLDIKAVMDTNYTSGTALLVPEGNDIAELVVAESLDLEMDYEKAKNQVWRGEVFERLAPVAYVPAAMVKITSIT